MAHKKGQGSSRNGRDSNAQRRGVKRFGGQRCGRQHPGSPGRQQIPCWRQCGSGQGLHAVRTDRRRRHVRPQRTSHQHPGKLTRVREMAESCSPDAARRPAPCRLTVLERYLVIGTRSDPVRSAETANSLLPFVLPTAHVSGGQATMATWWPADFWCLLGGPPRPCGNERRSAAWGRTVFRMPLAEMTPCTPAATTAPVRRHGRSTR